MGNILSVLASAMQKIYAFKHKYKAILLFILLNIFNSIWKRRAKNHPNIPMTVNSTTPFLGSFYGFLKTIKREGNAEIFYNEVIAPSLQKNNNHHILCFNGPSIPGLPRPAFGIQLYHPKLVEIVFTDTENFQKTHVVHDPLEELFGDGIFASDGERWRWHRKVASRIFSMRNLKQHTFGCGVRNAQRLITKMKQLKVMDIHDLFGRFTLQSFVESAFGEHLKIIESAPNSHPFNDSFDETLNLLMMRYGDPFWKIKRKYKIGQREGRDIPNNFKILNDFVYNVIDSRRNKKLFTDENGKEMYDLLSLFMKFRKNNDDSANFTKEIRDITMNFITAARDVESLCWNFLLFVHSNNLDDKGVAVMVFL